MSTFRSLPDHTSAPRRRESKADAAVTTLTSKLRGLAEVRHPEKAEEPILGGAVRGAVFGWLTEINAADELKAVGIKPRSTALLSGPPGCGKTTLAHHLAARLGIPLILVGAENLLGKYLGEAEQNTARLFDTLALTEIPAVVFLDEIDAIGGKRTSEESGASQARNSMLTVLLRKVEEFRGILIAATNRPDTLDQALWRRFGMQIGVDLPDDDARFAILKLYGRPFEFGDDLIEALTDLTSGAAPSLLRQIMEGAKRALVLGERIRQPADTPDGTFAAIIAQSKPHPDYELPPLWSDPGLVASLAGMPWPPTRIG